MIHRMSGEAVIQPFTDPKYSKINVGTILVAESLTAGILANAKRGPSS